MPDELLTFGEYVARAWQINSRRLWTYGLIVFLGILLCIVATYLACGLLLALARALGAAGLIVGIISAFCALFFGLSWTAAAAHAAIADESLTASKAFGAARSRTLPYLKVHLLASLAFMGGACLLFLPAIYFLVSFFFAPFIVMLEGVGGIEALIKSREYVRGRWWPVAVRLLLPWLLIGLVQLIPVLGQIASLILVPIPIIVSYLLYEDLKKTRGEFVFQATARQKGGVIALCCLPFLPFIVGVLMFSSVLLGLLVHANAGSNQKPVVAAGAPASASAKDAPLAAPPTAGSPAQAPPASLGISAQPLQGQIQGATFKFDSGKLDTITGVLALKQGKGFIGDAEVDLFLFDAGKNPEGLRMTDVSAAIKPHIHLMGKALKPDAYVQGYALKLELGRRNGFMLPGKIALTLPDKSQSHIEGAFEVTVEGPSKAPAMVSQAALPPAAAAPPGTQTARVLASNQTQTPPATAPPSPSPAKIEAGKSAGAAQTKAVEEKKGPASAEMPAAPGPISRTQSSQAAVRGIKRSCDAEISMICDGIKAQDALMACLLEHERGATPRCKRALEAAKPVLQQ